MTKPAVIFAMLQTGAEANGGIESISQVIRRLRDHRPVVLTNLANRQFEELQRLGIEAHVVPETASLGLRSNLGGYIATHRRYHRALKRLMRDTGARIVHANDPLAFQLSLSAVKTARGARIALNMRDTIDPDRRPPRNRYRFFFGAADHLFFLSEDMAARWERIAANARRACSVTYSIVDRDLFAPSDQEEESGRPIVLLSGIFRPKKGQLDFLRHVAPALAAGGAEIWFAGDFDPARDPYSAACAAAAEPLGDAVRFLGYRRDLPKLLNKARVVAIPSRYEGLMRVMIEAMSCARPVVSFDVCSAREALEEKSAAAGTVVPLGDFDGMARALLHYCSDAESSARAGRAGAEAADILFDAGEVVERYERAYRSMAS